MPLPFLTREVFDALIIVVIIIGLIAAFLRLRADFTRRLPDDHSDSR
jgi:hypothetical protein